MTVVLITIGILTLGLLFFAIANGSLRGGGTGFAALTSFHDFQPKDKREAVEVVIDEKAGRERFSQSNQDGSGKKSIALKGTDIEEDGTVAPGYVVREFRDTPETGVKGYEDESK